MKQPFQKIALILGFLACVSTSHAEESLTLSKAFDFAKLSDPAFAGSRINQQVQDFEVSKAISSFLPQVRFSAANGIATTDREVLATNISDRTSYTTKNNSLQIRQTIYNQSFIEEFKRSRALSQKGKADLEYAENDLMSRVIAAYLSFALFKEQVSIAEEKLQSLAEQLEGAKQRYAKGFGTVTEISESEVAYKMASTNLITINNRLSESKSNLETLIAKEVTQYSAPNPLGFKFPLDWIQPKTLDYWIEKAYASNKELSSLKFNLDIAEYEKQKNWSAHMPTLDLVASKTKSESDANVTIGSKFDTESLILQLNVPLYQGGFVSATVDQSQAKIAMVQQKILEQQNQLKRQLTDFYNQVVNGMTILDTGKTVISSSELALEGTEKGFYSGFRSNIDLVNARVKLFQSKDQYVQEFYKFINSCLQLQLIAGEFNQSELERISKLLQRN